MTPPTTRAAAGLAFTAADLHGLARLSVDGVVGVTDIVESMHHTIVRRAWPLGRAPTGRPGGITGAAYGAVRGTTRLVGKGLDAVFGAVTPAAVPTTREREAVVAALNGVWGDHLAASGNPLAIPMAMRIGGQPYESALQAPTGRLLVLVHGLAMNDLQWTRRGHDHGHVLARERGFTPVYLHYNSGRHVSENGRDFAAQLASLIADWPVPVRELVIVGHSMGGLVARSACALGAGKPWRDRLSKLVFLGTPHHGAPLERGGRLVDAMLELSPYAAPFARLGRMRSAGITDLRFGNVSDADWQHRERHSQTRDDRVPTPLPQGVRCFFVAATKSAQSSASLRSVAGDGLVPVSSALGAHRDPLLALKVPERQTLVVTQANHWDLLSRVEVGAQLCTWLA